MKPTIETILRVAAYIGGLELTWRTLTAETDELYLPIWSSADIHAWKERFRERIAYLAEEPSRMGRAQSVRFRDAASSSERTGQAHVLSGKAGSAVAGTEVPRGRYKMTTDASS